MRRRQADIAAALVVAGVVAVGLLLAWDAYLQRRTIDQTMGGMMGGMMGETMYGPDPALYVLGTVLVGALLAVGYVFLRSNIEPETGVRSTDSDDFSGTGSVHPTDSVANGSAVTTDSETTGVDRGVELDEAVEPESADVTESDPKPAATASSRPASALLDVLPDDERRILQPVLESPGLTQIALRDRSDFSKSKVSQTVSELEKRGLLYRERQGRTYRVYPSDELAASDDAEAP